MVNVYSRKCRTEGCGKQPCFGLAGTKTAEYCAQHALNGMVNFCKMMGETESGKKASFGMTGTKKAKNCAQHALNEMVDVCSSKCRTEGCGKGLSYGVAITRTSEYCTQYARLKCGVEGYTEGEVDPHRSGKKNIGKILPNGVKYQTFHPPATPSPPSEGSQGSRKRVRYPETTSTASMRPISRELAGGAGTMLDNDDFFFHFISYKCGSSLNCLYCT
ncbi:unnamed protein product [Ascophyllum nodosum]